MTGDENSELPAPTFSISSKGGKKRLSKAERLKKRKKQKMIAGGAFVFLLLVVVWGVQPLRGTMNTGICRTVIEGRLLYPETLRITSFENNEPHWRLYYTYTGSFGEHRSDMVDCLFKTDEAGNQILADVRINRKKMDPQELQLINMAIPAIVAYKPDTLLPRPPADGDLLALKPE